MKEFVKKNDLVLVVSLALSFLIGLFGPIEFYFSNIYNVWYDLYNILPICVVMFVLLFFALCVIGIILGKESKADRLYIYVLSVLTICLYIQGTFIKIPYGEMNGETIEWDKYAGDELKSSIVWLALIAIAIIIYRKKQNQKMFSVLKTIMICLIVIQFISLVIIGTTGEGFKAKKSMRPVDEKAFTYSKDENFIILVLDTFDSRVFEDYILDGNEQKAASQYEDFTYYRNTMGMFTLTNYAFPHIVTGEKYLGDMYYGEYIEHAYEKSPLIDRLLEENWSIRIHTDQPLPEEGKSYFDNAKEVTYAVSDSAGMMKGVYKLVFFKYLPTALKKYVYYPYEYLEGYKAVKTIDGLSANECSYTEDDWDNKAFYDSLGTITVEGDAKSCQIYHIKGLHALRNLDSNLQYISDSEELYSLEQEAAVVSDIVATWLEELKKNDAYDNSTIIIMADHGSVEYVSEEDNFAQCPLLMIKAKGEQHEFAISEAPVSYDDLQNIYSLLLSGDDGETSIEKAIVEENGADWDLYGIDELKKYRMQKWNVDNAGRTRTMIFHRFAGNLGGKSTGGTGYELCSEYQAYYGTQIQLTGKTYP